MAPADSENIRKHLDAVAETIDRAAAVVPANHRQLVDPEAVLSREVKRFHVEAESIALCSGKNLLRRGCREAFKTALCVLD